MTNNKDAIKLGLVIPNVPSYSETFFHNKIVNLLEQGFEVKLFIKHPIQRENYICPVYEYPYPSKNPSIRLIQSVWIAAKTFVKSPGNFVRFTKLLSREGYSLKQYLRSVVASSFILPHQLDWLHFGYASMGLDCEFVGKAIGAKVAVSLRGYDVAVKPILNKDCYHLLWKNVDKIHTISDDLLNLAYAEGLSKSIEVEKITPAIKTIEFTERKDYRVSEEVSIFVSIARLHWKKGLEYTLEALAEAKKNGLKFQYNIIGEGAEYERLIFATHQLGLENEVKFMGKIPHEQIAEELLKSALYLQYSIQEGFCNSVLEAQAMGLLCIVSDAEGLPENVLDEKSGWIVPKRNPSALAKKINDVLNLSIDRKKEVSEFARQRVQSEFNIDKQNEAFVEFYLN